MIILLHPDSWAINCTDYDNKLNLTGGNNMNKGQLVDRISRSAGITKNAADMALNGFMDGVAEALNMGEKVTLIGFGTFSVSDRKARTGRNPRTGEPMEIPAKRIVKFKAGTRLSESVGQTVED